MASLAQASAPPSQRAAEIRNPLRSERVGRSLHIQNAEPAALQAAVAPRSLHRPAANALDDVATQNLRAAYRALADGALGEARERYSDVLRAHPNNVDALNGLGFVAWRERNREQAVRHFRAASEADPTDALSASQLILLAAAHDSDAEAQARRLVATQPESAAAQFALGNLLVAQARWGDALQAYLRALDADADNPDILFNLAVSLEHLKRSPEAQHYYIEALHAVSARPGSFDPDGARRRIERLGEVSPPGGQP